ncbi:hypothetical protein [Brevibacterium antiquum]|uniref:hypothetical protein n=1 Tax=Brevibacterium antiquum TaxID=234835 RepID=UPI000C782764|nr:hypothetical protein [Brevibacterium antiquum]
MWAKIGEFVKIRAEQIEADAIDGMVITGPTIQSARTGQRWVGDASGIRIFNADNEVRTQLSPDGSAFKGEVEADTLVVNGGSELRSTENKLAQGAKLTLEAGVTDPTAPPTVQPYWDSLEFEISRPYTNVDGLVGLAYDGTHYWSAHKDDHGTGGRMARIFAVRIDPQTGVGEYVGGQLPTGKPRVAPWSSEVFGVTCIGSELFWLGRSYYDGVVWVTDLAGEFKRAFAYPELGYSATNPLKYKPGIGNNGTDVIIAQCADDGTLVTRTYNKTTGVRTIVRDMSPVGFNSDVLGVYVGAADWGGGTFITVAGSTRKLLTYSSAGVYDASKTFPMPDGSQDTGVVFQGGKFRTLNASGVIHEYADNNTGDASGDWWATYRWSVDADDDGFNDYTSRIGPVKKFTWPLRAKLRFMGAPLPDGVGYITPSIAKKATSPVRTDFRTPIFSVHAGESIALISILPTNWQSGAAPGDSNDFPDAEPSTLVSASSTFQVNGDGSGHWGPLTFNADGTMTGVPMQATGSTTIGVSAAAGNTANVTVTLPWGAFTTPPRIFLTKQGDTLAKYNPYAKSITTTSFTLGLYSGDSSSTTNSVSVAWHAIGGV